VSNAYDPREIESRWQKRWQDAQVYRTKNPGDPGFDPAQKKYYVLDMFPYPSGSGLHVGHALGYVGTDIVARKKRMEGCNVLHPMGWDAFGLPAEQEVAEEHGDLIVPALIDARNAAPHARAVEHVVVHERREVDHLDDRRDRGMLVGAVARRVAREEDERAAQLLAAEALHVIGHVADGVRTLDDLAHEDFAHALHAVLHRNEDAFEAGVRGAHRRAFGPSSSRATGAAWSSSSRA